MIKAGWKTVLIKYDTYTIIVDTIKDYPELLSKLLKRIIFNEYNPNIYSEYFKILASTIFQHIS